MTYEWSMSTTVISMFAYVSVSVGGSETWCRGFEFRTRHHACNVTSSRATRPSGLAMNALFPSLRLFEATVTTSGPMMPGEAVKFSRLLNNHAHNIIEPTKTSGCVASAPNSFPSSLIPVTGRDIHIHYQINMLQRFGSLQGTAVHQGNIRYNRYNPTSRLYCVHPDRCSFSTESKSR